MNEKSRTPLDENALIALWAISNGQRGEVIDELLHGKIGFYSVSPLETPKPHIHVLEAMSSGSVTTALQKQGAERDRFRLLLDVYLADYKKGRIDWPSSGSNSLPWPEQEEGTMKCLRRMRAKFGEKFVVSNRDFRDSGVGRPIETLLVLDHEGVIKLEKLMDAGFNAYDLVVQTIKLPPDSKPPLAIDTATNNKKGGRPPALKYEGNRFWYRGKDYIPRKSAKYASLCDFLYPICPTLDKTIYWKDVFKPVYGEESTSPIEDREKIRGLVKALNRWSDHQGWDLGALLKFEDEHIRRLR